MCRTCPLLHRTDICGVVQRLPRRVSVPQAQVRFLPPLLMKFTAMKILTLIIKQKWFDAILSGEKTVETREVRPTNTKYISYRDNNTGKVYKKERSLHPSLIKQIILLFYKHSKDVSSQLIFTTHESSLMDQKIFRRDEIWLMKKDNNGISSFGRMDNLYNVRFDKMLQNSYLNGEYGATPIFETEEEINKLFSSLK